MKTTEEQTRDTATPKGMVREATNPILAAIDRDIDRLRALREIVVGATLACRAFHHIEPYALGGLSLLQIHNRGNLGNAKELARQIGTDWHEDGRPHVWRGFIHIPGHAKIDLIIHGANPEFPQPPFHKPIAL